jgi:hypothetical protein
MTEPSPPPSTNEIADTKPPGTVKRRGMTIGHWLLIIIIAALFVDISIRIVAFRRSSLAAAQRLNSQMAIQKAFDNLRKAQDSLKNVEEWNRQADKSQELIEEYVKRRERMPLPRDPSKGNIIPLEH